MFAAEHCPYNVIGTACRYQKCQLQVSLTSPSQYIYYFINFTFDGSMALRVYSQFVLVQGIIDVSDFSHVCTVCF